MNLSYNYPQLFLNVCNSFIDLYSPYLAHPCSLPSPVLVSDAHSCTANSTVSCRTLEWGTVHRVVWVSWVQGQVNKQCTWMHVHLEPRDQPEVLLLGCFPPFCWGGSFTGTGLTGITLKHHGDPPVSTLLSLVLQIHTAMPNSLCGLRELNACTASTFQLSYLPGFQL